MAKAITMSRNASVPSRPQTGAPGRLALLLVWLMAAVSHAEVGTGFSPLFNVDTRWGFDTSYTVSGFFTVDTRFSGSTGEGNSRLFTVDTRGAATGSATISGQTTDDAGAGLAGATVAALQNGVVWAQTMADSTGAYVLASLPEGTYQVQAAETGYLTVNRYGVSLSANQSVVENFSLAGKPAAPVVVTATSPAPVVTVTFLTGTLEWFNGSGFVPVPPNYTVDQTKPTVILTHGWNSDPTYWPKDMANSMNEGHANANILAWDWRQEADTGFSVEGLSLATCATPREGEKLGQALAATFTPAYNQGVHFIGHSLGTMVNATAANYLHANGYSPTHTQMTLLDEAEAANFVSPASFVSPIPSQRAWIDNYVSFVGLYHPEAVNVLLEESPYYADASGSITLASVHGYACRWYGYTAATPSQSLLGNRYSYEQLGSAAQFPSPSQYPLGSVFGQDIVGGELGLTRLYTADEIAAADSVWTAGMTMYGLQSSMSFAAGAVQSIGSVAVDVGMAFIPQTPAGTPAYSGIAGSTPAYYTDNPVESLPVWSLQVNLQTQPAPPGPLHGSSGNGIRPLGKSPASGGPNLPACIWIPVQIPTNAAIFAFDFTFNGDPANDLLSASINSTNVFALEARFMPTNAMLNSGPIDVSLWAGQTVELFFGLLGGTSTYASVNLDGMRFYHVEAPSLQAQTSGNSVVITWPLSASGYLLETSDNLAAMNSWVTVTNAPVIAGFQNTVTNDVSAGSRFFRLRKP